ncbi:Fibroleukin [Stylophora pistillata]|uniref:Fibroleukin n=2 Tax=Stylophora pistillata TaxID=50429 RepID=A0A2B4RJX0_STYPI|nr:Fibroleukin [Stylophora pistillata]
MLSVVLIVMFQMIDGTCKTRESGIAKNCAELYKCGQTISDVYTIDPDGSGAFNVYCDQTTADGGWTVIQKRVDGTVDFNRTWNDYKKGFGNFLIREFWLGLDKIQRLTQNKRENKLRVDLGVTDDKTVYAEYEWFGIENETADYKLHIGKFSSATVKDSLSIHNGMLFGTWDRLPADRDCALRLGGGWWYLYFDKYCTVSSNLNGIYPHRGSNSRIHWANLNSEAKNNNPRSAEMKIRPVDFF